MGYKVALDTCVLDWLLEDGHLGLLQEVRIRHNVSVIVTAEVAQEVNQIPDLPAHKRERRERLQALIKQYFFPVEPTLIPIAGIARAGANRSASPKAVALRAAAHHAGLRRMDILHVVNAACHRCHAFATLDERLLRKASVVRNLANIEILRP